MIAEKFSTNSSLWRAVLVCSIGSVAGFLLHVYFESIDQHEAGNFSLHLAMAFLIALILVVTLEFRERQSAHQEMVQYRKMIAEDVFGVTLEKLVPPKLISEIVEIAKIGTVKENCSYLITIKDSPAGTLNGQMLVERKTTFTIRNLLSQGTEYVLTSEAPEHTELKINNSRIALKEGENLARVNRNGQDMRLEVLVPLDAKGTANISLVSVVAMPIAGDAYTFIQNTAVIGLKVIVRNEYTDEIENPEIVMVHPGREELFLDELRVYHFDRAILPGQGFILYWKRKAGSAPQITSQKEDAAALSDKGAPWPAQIGDAMKKDLPALLLALVLTATAACGLAAQSNLIIETVYRAARTFLALLAAGVMIDPFG